MSKEFQNMTWDYLIIGTGMGGATIGYSLATSGKKILYIEKGKSLRSKINSSEIFLKGSFPDENLKHFENLSPADITLLKLSGRYTDFLTDISFAKKPKKFLPLLGQGVGGSTLLYGAALERFFPEDFQATQFFKNFKDSSTVDWPISYSDLEKYYKMAEDIYQVVGGQDPLRTAFQNHDLYTPPLSSAGQKIFDVWKKNELHPYRLPVGHKPHNLSNCPGCQAIICPAADKSDAGSKCLYPSLNFENVHLLDDSEVIQILSNSERVTEVLVKQNSNIFNLKANTVILAAGAIDTPKILFKSKSIFFPQGLANSSGLVGKNLSRHFMDLYMVNMDPYGNDSYIEKEFALNDFYFHAGEKLGTVQSLGNPPSIETALFEMYYEYYKSSKIVDKLYYLMASYLGKGVIKSLFKNNLCIASIMDDVSYEDNALFLNPDDSTISLHYKIRSEGLQRLEKFRSLILKSFKPLKVKLHKQGENNQRLAHASGTCRMGDDPKKSVVDKYNKTHDLENLYIVDASFFPSGSGINPALTIAANALRIGEHLLHL